MIDADIILAVGFRNLIIHEYAKLELSQVYRIAESDIQDLHEFIKAVISKLGISG